MLLEFWELPGNFQISRETENKTFIRKNIYFKWVKLTNGAQNLHITQVLFDCKYTYKFKIVISCVLL